MKNESFYTSFNNLNFEHELAVLVNLTYYGSYGVPWGVESRGQGGHGGDRGLLIGHRAGGRTSGEG